MLHLRPSEVICAECDFDCKVYSVRQGCIAMCTEGNPSENLTLNCHWNYRWMIWTCLRWIWFRYERSEGLWMHKRKVARGRVKNQTTLMLEANISSFGTFFQLLFSHLQKERRAGVPFPDRGGGVNSSLEVKWKGMAHPRGCICICQFRGGEGVKAPKVSFQLIGLTYGNRTSGQRTKRKGFTSSHNTDHTVLVGVQSLWPRKRIYCNTGKLPKAGRNVNQNVFVGIYCGYSELQQAGVWYPCFGIVLLLLVVSLDEAVGGFTPRINVGTHNIRERQATCETVVPCTYSLGIWGSLIGLLRTN